MSWTVNLLTCDVVTRAGRVYPRDEIQKAIDKFIQNFPNGKQCEPDTTKCIGNPVNLANTSHVIYNPRLDKDDLLMDVNFLSTPMGEMLKTVKKNLTAYPTFNGKVTQRDGHNVAHELTINSVDLVLSKP